MWRPRKPEHDSHGRSQTRPRAGFACVALAAVLGLHAVARGQDYRVFAGTGGVTQAVVERVERMTADALRRLAPRFPGTPNAPFRIYVHRTRAELPDRIRDVMHEGSPGVALLGASEIHLVLEFVQARAPGDLATVVDHELVHILLHQFAGPAGRFVPRWVHEGLAQHLTGYLYLGAKEEEIVFGARTGSLPRFRDLQQGFPRSSGYDMRIAYALSHSFARYLEREVGLETLLRVVRRCTAELEFPEAFVAETGDALADFELEWLDWVKSGSGARFRVVMQQCFSLLIVLALPLLALAAAKRWNADHQRQRRLGSEDAAADRLRAAERDLDADADVDPRPRPPEEP